MPARKQCKACPWKVSTIPDEDIPNGYDVNKHRNLKNTIADGSLNLGSPLRLMACHESAPGHEKPCVGWLANQLGPGNNIALRFRAMKDRSLVDFELVGEQHQCLEDTLPADED